MFCPQLATLPVKMLSTCWLCAFGATTLFPKGGFCASTLMNCPPQLWPFGVGPSASVVEVDWVGDEPLPHPASSPTKTRPIPLIARCLIASSLRSGPLFVGTVLGDR